MARELKTRAHPAVANYHKRRARSGVVRRGVRFGFGGVVHYLQRVRPAQLVDGVVETAGRSRDALMKTGKATSDLLKFFSRRYDVDSIDNRDPELIDKLCQWLPKWLNTYFRAEVRGLDRVPPGAGLYVGNHNTGMVSQDSFIFGAAVFNEHGIEAVPYGLGHEKAIRVPLIHQIVMPLGGVRACHENARRLFDAGKKVLVYPGGDVESLRPYRLRNRIVFDGRMGYVRLALNENVPIIPVVTAGSHGSYVVLSDMRWFARMLRLDRLLRTEVWPLTVSMPLGLTFGPHPFHIPFPVRILIEILEPIHFERHGPEAAEDDQYVRACADRVEATMQECLDRLADEIDRRSAFSTKALLARMTSRRRSLPN